MRDVIEQASKALAPQLTGNTRRTWFKLSAKQQREIFGLYLFGKKSLRLHGWGIATKKKIAYGQDFDIQSYTWEEIAEAIIARETI